MSNSIFKTQSGLKYALDDNLYEKLVDDSRGLELINKVYETTGTKIISNSNTLIYKFERIIEASENFASFISFIVFTIMLFQNITALEIIAIPFIIAYILGAFLSINFILFKLPFLTNILTFYGVLSKFFINFVFILIYSLIVLKQWQTLILYIVLFIILFSLESLIFGYKVKLKFNNKVANYLINKKG